jgi:hypothetical protein
MPVFEPRTVLTLPVSTGLALVSVLPIAPTTGGAIGP